jgi:hypothetical protein
MKLHEGMELVDAGQVLQLHIPRHDRYVEALFSVFRDSIHQLVCMAEYVEFPADEGFSEPRYFIPACDDIDEFWIRLTPVLKNSSAWQLEPGSKLKFDISQEEKVD